MDEHGHTTRGVDDFGTMVDPLEEGPSESDDAARTCAANALPPDPRASSSDPGAIPPDPNAGGESVRLACQLVRGTRLERARLAARELDRSLAEKRAAAIDVPDLDASTGDPATLSHRLRALVRAGDADMAEQIRLLVAFDDEGLWKREGYRTCVHWMGMYLGIAEKSAYERLYVGRRLPRLPWITRLFRVGELSWSKVLRLSRVARPDTERALAAAALDMSVVEIEALCREHRHPGTGSEDDDDAGAWAAWRERGLDFRRMDDHTTEIRVRVPHDMAASLKGALEHGIETLRDGGAADHLAADEPLPGPPAPSRADAPFEKPTPRQRRADALVLLGSRSLALAGEAVAAADRYRVLLSVDVAIVREGIAANDAAVAPGLSARAETAPDDADAEAAEAADGADAAARDPACRALPTRRAVISGFGTVAPAVALRIACHAGLTAIATDEHGDVLGVGRRMRVLPLALSRALAARDPVCRVPGCRSTHRLEDHHVEHWAHGGDSALATMTRVCHPRQHWLHEGGYTLRRMRVDDVALSVRAEASLDTGADRRAARALVATVVRYRLLDRDGRTVRESFEADGAVEPLAIESHPLEPQLHADADMACLLSGLRREADSGRRALSARAEVSTSPDEVTAPGDRAGGPPPADWV